MYYVYNEGMPEYELYEYKYTSKSAQFHKKHLARTLGVTLQAYF